MKNAARARLLPVIALALAVFAGLRATNVWFGFADADAQDETAEVLGATAVTAAAVAVTDSAVAPDAAPASETAGEVERRILENLSERRALIDQQEKDLAARQAVLAATEQRLEEKIAAFQEERAALLELREAQAADDAEGIASVVSAYERMKAKDAAAIFNALDEDVLLPIAAGMRTQALAGVLAEMTPDKARRLTTLLTERNSVASDTAPTSNGPL